jgi:Ran GTPase-activating protein (RanGAP) involved in mRNA processing and transport
MALKGLVGSLFKAKIKDNDIEYSEEDYNRFRNQLEKAFPLGTLDFTCQQIGISILTKLTKVLRESKHIRSFQLYGNLIRDHGIHSLCQLLVTNPRVVILDIGCNDLTNQSVPAVIDIILGTSVTSLQIGAPQIAWHSNKFSIQSLTEILAAVHEANRIECLGLAGLRLSVRQGARVLSLAEPLARYLRSDSALQSLSIGNCSFPHKDIEIVIRQGLFLNQRLRFLDVNHSFLMDPIGADFTRELYYLPKLRYLNLSECSLSPAAGRGLAESLRRGSSLIVLDLSGNLIGDEGVSALLEVLITNQTLTELNVSNNAFGKGVAPLLTRLIADNPVMCNLNFSMNSIDDDGAFAIAEAIGENECITNLSLASCRITDCGAVRLATSLIHNVTLRKFRINNNFLTRESGYSIIDEIRGNEHLFLLDLTATQIDHFVIKAAHDLCVRNKQIQKEKDLQPLKKQLVQLSIQQTKIPEAESRLKNLESTLTQIETEIATLEEDLDATRIRSSQELTHLTKAISEKTHLITDEEKAIETIAADTERITKEYNEKYQEILDSTEREKALIEKLEAAANLLDEKAKQIADDAELQKAQMEKEITELEELIKSTLQIVNDPEQVRNYQPPELDFLKDVIAEEPIFLVDQVLTDMHSKPKKGKKAKAKKKPKKK